MKIRNGFIVAAAAIATLLLVSPSAWAGSPRQHRWEGVAIGVGAAILGSALIHHPVTYIYAPVRMVHPPRAPFRHHPPEIRHPGHCKPSYRGPQPYWKRNHRGYGVHPDGPYKGRSASKHSYQHHGPDHHRHGSGAGSHPKK